MNLNSFHLAGCGGTAKLTAGVPRFRELLNATEKISTPSMTFPTEDVLVRYVVVGDLIDDTTPGAEIPSAFYEAHARYHRLDKPVNRGNIIQLCKDKCEGCTFLEIKSAIINACREHVVGTVSTSEFWLFDVHADDMESVKSAVVGGIEGVKKQFSHHGKTTTEGTSNLYAALSLHAEAITNHVLETCRILGVEAANSVLLSEMKAVMEAACYINERHIQLLVDTMTRTGKVVAASRHGMSKTKQPVLQRASFEVSTQKKRSFWACFGSKFWSKTCPTASPENPPQRKTQSQNHVKKISERQKIRNLLGKFLPKILIQNVPKKISHRGMKHRKPAKSSAGPHLKKIRINVPG